MQLSLLFALMFINVISALLCGLWSAAIYRLPCVRHEQQQQSASSDNHSKWLGCWRQRGEPIGALRSENDGRQLK